MKKRNLLKQYKGEVDGQEVIVNQFKTKERKEMSYARPTTSTCPCCGSKLELNEQQNFYCIGDKLTHWATEFEKYFAMSDTDKVKYLSNITSDSQFFDLYDRWKYSKEIDKPDEYNCGYTNNIALPIANTRTVIPDPMVVKRLELALNRPLTEEELMNESQLYGKFNKVSDRYFKGSKQIIIPYVVLPDEISFYPELEKEE